MAKSTEITKATTEETTLAPSLPAGILDTRPDDIKSGDRRGLESMTKDDMAIPRLSLAQALSPQVTEGDPKMVEGMKPGDLFNSMTNQNYGREVFVQIIRKDALRAMEFNPIDDGGGVKDPNVPLSDDRCKWHGDEKPVATIFRDYIARIIPSGEVIALSFKSSGLKVAKILNGLIGFRNAPIFRGIYKITTDTELVPKPHKIFKVDNAGWAADEHARIGETMFAAIKDLDLSDKIDRGREPGDEDFDPATIEAQTRSQPEM